MVRDKARKLELGRAHGTSSEGSAQLGSASSARSRPSPSWHRQSKSLLVLWKINFLLSLLTFVGVLLAVYGAKFGIGFAVSS